METIDSQLKKAVKLFWKTRSSQSKSQGRKSGVKDQGGRTAVTGGKHLDGFVGLCKNILIDAGIQDADIHWNKGKELPGFFRAEKSWDLVVFSGESLIAVIEFKAQVGPSFGNNFNNRTEEALGNATDLWAAYREGAFSPSNRPWLGYVFILEDCEKVHSPVKVRQPHFPVFPEFKTASYKERYEVLMTKMLRERLYDGTALILTKRPPTKSGIYSCENQELSFEAFAKSLHAHAGAHANLK